MAELLWKLNLPAGRIAAASDYGTYLIQANETNRYWTVEFTDFPTDNLPRALPPCPQGRYPSWDAACALCTKHALACAESPILVGA